jgi:hypothetical protein
VLFRLQHITLVNASFQFSIKWKEILEGTEKTKKLKRNVFIMTLVLNVIIITMDLTNQNTRDSVIIVFIIVVVFLMTSAVVFGYRLRARLNAIGAAPTEGNAPSGGMIYIIYIYIYIINRYVCVCNMHMFVNSDIK